LFRKFWTERKLLVRNPENNKCVVAHALSWGPAPGLKGRFADLSLPAYEAIGTRTGANVQIAFATDDAPPGPVPCPTQPANGQAAVALGGDGDEAALQDFVTVLSYGEGANGHASARVHAQSTDPSGDRAARFVLAVALPSSDFERLKTLNIAESGMALLRQALTEPNRRPLGNNTSWMLSGSSAGNAESPLIFFDDSTRAARIENRTLNTPAGMPGSFGYLAVYFFRALGDANTQSAPGLLERLRTTENLDTAVEVQSRLTKALYGAPTLATAE
jgi:hypothetical protein